MEKLSRKETLMALESESWQAQLEYIRKRLFYILVRKCGGYYPPKKAK